MFESKEIKSYMASNMNNFHVSRDFSKKCAIIDVKRAHGEITFEESEKEIKLLFKKYPEEASKFRLIMPHNMDA